jgi:DNA polymerase III alpha subunit (gram-positive type)
MTRNLNLEEFVQRNLDKVFIVMDTETSGLDVRESDAIEVSAIKARFNGRKIEVLDTFDSFINPGYPLSEAILEFNRKNNTGVDDAFLADKPKAAAVARALATFFRKDPACVENSCWTLVGHNIVRFDVPYIEKLAAAGNVSLTNTYTFDTMLHAQSIIPFRGRGTHTLGRLHESTPQRLFKENPLYHNSLGDCLATLDILEQFAEKVLDAELRKQEAKAAEPIKPAATTEPPRPAFRIQKAEPETAYKTATPPSPENIPPERPMLRLRLASSLVQEEQKER